MNNELYYELARSYSHDYANAIILASDLVSEHGENPEYDRGIYEVLGRLYGVPGEYAEDRVKVIENDVRRVRPIEPVRSPSLAPRPADAFAAGSEDDWDDD